VRADSGYSGEASEGEGAGVLDSQAVVICGFGELGQTLANMLESPLAMSLERGRVPYIAFDLQPSRLRRAREAGFNVLYGDASRPAVRPTCYFRSRTGTISPGQALDGGLPLLQACLSQRVPCSIFWLQAYSREVF
jgi:hypothetical protein